MAKSKVTLAQISVIGMACQTALQQQTSYGTRFKLREVLRALAPHGDDFDAEKQRLVERLAEKDDEGKPIVVDDRYEFGENQAEADRLWRELANTQVTIQHKLTLDDVAGLPADPALDGLELLLA